MNQLFFEYFEGDEMINVNKVVLCVLIVIRALFPASYLQLQT